MDSRFQPLTDKVEPMLIKIVCDDELEAAFQKSSTSEEVKFQVLLNSQTFFQRACFKTFLTCPIGVHADGNCRHQVICGTHTLV